MATDDRRAHGRSEVRYACRIRTPDGRVLDGCVENLGVLGALVSTADLEAALDVSDHVILGVEVPEHGAVEVEGEILRLEQEFAEGDIRRYFAIRFNQSFAMF
jgi:hypothetical protein